MRNFLSILIGVMAIYETTKAAPNQHRHSVLNENLEDLSLFELPYDLSPSRNSDSESTFSEREKRFFDSIFPQFDFFTRRQSSFSSYSGYRNKEYNQNKGGGGGGGGGGLDDILRNPQDFWLNILSNRRPAAVFLPVFVQPIDCGCSGTNQSPNNEPTNPFGSDVVKPMENSTISLPNRFNEEVDDDEDGQRDISFKPQQPNRPISQQPPFEHGSVQAGEESSPNSNGAPGISASSLPESSPAPMPSICDGAVVACCLQLNIGNCFQRQGCEDTSIYGDPCSPSVVSSILEKFQRYYKERGINKSFY